MTGRTRGAVRGCCGIFADTLNNAHLQEETGIVPFARLHETPDCGKAAPGLHLPPLLIIGLVYPAATVVLMVAAFVLVLPILLLAHYGGESILVSGMLLMAPALYCSGYTTCRAVFVLTPPQAAETRFETTSA